MFKKLIRGILIGIWNLMAIIVLTLPIIIYWIAEKDTTLRETYSDLFKLYFIPWNNI